MSESMMLDRRALIGSLAALSVPGLAYAKPKDYPATQAYLETVVGAKQLSCFVVGIKRGNKPVEYLNAGTLGLDTPLKAAPDSIFRIYSMTKPITGVAFMTLVEKGLLRVDQPITDILPEFKDQRVMTGTSIDQTRPVASPILMRHLVTHTSGLSYSINGNAPLARAYTTYGLTAGLRTVGPGLISPSDKYPPARDLETFGRRLATLPLDFDPGTKWQYSVGLDLMGLIIQRVSGMPFEDYMRQAIFNPLKMYDSDFVVPGSKKERLTTVYLGRQNLVAADDRKTSAFLRDRDMVSGGGGGVSTTADYMRFVQMLMNGGTLDGVRIMKPETAQVARNSLMNPGTTASGIGGAGNTFGAAVQILGKASAAGEGAGTFGWDGAAGTTMWVDPVNKVAVAGMVQIQSGVSIHAPLREAIYKDFRALGALAKA